MLSDGTRVSLGGLDPARSRHNWARSAALVAEGTVYVGGPDGRVTAFRPGAAGVDRPDSQATDRWSSGSGYVVSLADADGRLAVGERGDDATVSLLSSRTGERQWQYAAAEAVGTATGDSLLEQPYVVDIVVAEETTVAEKTIVAAVRRYERTDGDRSWSSAVLAFDRDGGVRWRHAAEASPIALDIDGGRVAVAYNRRPTDDDGDGLVVLDVATGDRILSWDPEAAGDRRVGDVAFVDGAIAVASHGDKRGYLLDIDGNEQWCVDLGTPREVDGETVYTYPNHVCAAGGTAVFVTGNTFAESTRDPDARHPNEHTVTAVDDGDVVWSHEVGGFARDVSVAGPHVVVPSAQHFRKRSSDTHAVHLFDARDGHLAKRPVAGIAASGAIGEGTLATVEEPVEYHDEGVVHGAHRVHTWEIDRPVDGD